MSVEALEALVRLTVAGSVAIVAVLLLRRPLRRAFDALVAYAAWMLVPAVAAAMLLPAPVRPLAALAGIARVAPLEPRRRSMRPIHVRCCGWGERCWPRHGSSCSSAVTCAASAR